MHGHVSSDRDKRRRTEAARVWKSHQRREKIALALIVSTPFAFLGLARAGERLGFGDSALIVWFVAHGISILILHLLILRLRCPQCGQTFLVRRDQDTMIVVRNVLASRCLHCGLHRYSTDIRDE